MSDERRARAKRVLLCCAGGYQAYALPGFILSLLRHFADDVQVILSPAASRMASVYAIEVASRHKVYVEIDDRGPDVFVPHIELSRDADLILVYPATASILGKIANGIGDELIAAVILAATAPVFFVPIANTAMLEHPAVRRNIEQLREDGYVVLPSPYAVEVATREGLEDISATFPMPTLLARMAAALRDRSSSAARRSPLPDGP